MRVADDADIGNRLVSGGERRTGNFAIVLLLAEHRLRRCGKTAHPTARLSQRARRRDGQRNDKRRQDKQGTMVRSALGQSAISEVLRPRVRGKTVRLSPRMRVRQG